MGCWSGPAHIPIIEKQEYIYIRCIPNCKLETTTLVLTYWLSVLETLTPARFKIAHVYGSERILDAWYSCLLSLTCHELDSAIPEEMPNPSPCIWCIWSFQKQYEDGWGE